MRASMWLLIGLIGLGAAPLTRADEGEGLTLPRLHGRIRLGMGVEPAAFEAARNSAYPPKISGASVLGDYYFGRAAARTEDPGGFRATTGVFLGSRLGLWGGYAPTMLSGNLFSVEQHSFSLATPPQTAEGAGQDNSAVPYLGLGYSSASLKTGWGFSADLGLMALNPGNAVRLGRVFNGGQSLDDAVRELRLSPMVQLGVAYQF